MNQARKILYWVAAFTLAAFAVSANAAKTITLSDSTVSGQAPFLNQTLTTGTVYVQLNNIGNSNASSFELDWKDSPLFTVNSATVNTSKGPITVTPIAGQTPGGYKGVVFTFTLPQKTSVVIALNVTVGAGATCSLSQMNWQAYAWTGGVGTPSSSFTSPSLGTYTSNLPGASGCKLTFTQQPKDAFVSSVITTVAFNSTATPNVTVQATDQNNAAVQGVVVSIGDIGACSVSGSATTDSSGNAVFTSISSSSAGACQLTASASGFGGDTSAGFNVVQQDGTLSCASTALHKGNLDPDAVPGLGAADWGLKRGQNTDGTCGFDVPFTFSVDGDTNTAIFTEDSLGQPTSVEYIIRWTSVPVEHNGWSSFQPCISYGISDPTFATDPDTGVCVGDYVPAPACVSNNVSGGTAVMPNIPDDYPYNTSFEDGRPQYKPFLSDGVTPQQAKVCVSQQGWTSDTGNGVQYWHKFIDQTDTRIVGP